MQTAKVLRSFGYEVVDFLGKGSYGEVRLANSKRHQKKVAIKIMHRRLKPHIFVHKLLPQELLILKIVRHPHIAQVHEMFDMPWGQVFVVMEAGVKDLEKKIRDLGRVPIGKAKIWFSQILSAVEYLHQQDIVHRDLKCSNVLLMHDNQIKLVDFGLATFSEGLCDQFFCTPMNAAPEVLLETPYDAKKSDVWSLGVMFYVMVTGKLPFSAVNKKGLIEAQKKPLTFPDGFTVDKNCKQFITYLLQYDPSTRPSVTDVANHPWLRADQEWNVEGVEGVDGVEVVESVEGVDGVEVAEVVEAVDGVEVVESVKAVDGVEVAEVVEAVDGVEVVKGVDGVEVVKGVEVVEGVEGVECVDGVEVVKGVDGVEVVKGVEVVEGVEGVEGVEVVEEEEHGCFSAAVKRVAAPILRASRTLREKVQTLFKVKSTSHSSSSASKTSSDVGDQSGLVMEPTVSQKTKRLRFPKFKILKKRKSCSMGNCWKKSPPKANSEA